MNMTVLGVKHGTFKSQDGSQVAYHQIALDMGNYLKVFKVKPGQAAHLDMLSPGDVLSDSDGFTVDKFFVFT